MSSTAPAVFFQPLCLGEFRFSLFCLFFFFFFAEGSRACFLRWFVRPRSLKFVGRFALGMSRTQARGECISTGLFDAIFRFGGYTRYSGRDWLKGRKVFLMRIGAKSS